MTTPIDPLLTQASGSVGSTTYGHNQHGPWTRSRGIPTDPNSPRQQTVRTALSDLVTAWNAALTQPERAAWERYARAVLLPSRLGRRANAGGLPHYIRSNVPRIQAAEVSLPRVDEAPALFDLGPFTPITRIVLNAVDDTIHPFFDTSDAWSTEDGAAALFAVSRGMSPSIAFFKGPYRYAGAILGAPPSDTSPATIPTPFLVTPSDRVFVKFRVTRSDGRLSAVNRLPADPVAQVAPLPIDALIVGDVFPFANVFVTFDALVTDPVPFLANWAARFLGTIYSTVGLTVTGSIVDLRVQVVGATGRPDAVLYSPPPSTLKGLLTGLSVAAFSHPLHN